MGSKAARVDDTVSHGGNIVTGSPNVDAEGKPAARKADVVLCEVHGASVVAESSATVFVNGMGFARLGDGCICAGDDATVGPGQEDVVYFIWSVHGQQTIEEILEDENGYGPHLQAILQDANQDGALDTFLMQGAVATVDIDGEWGRFAMSVIGGEVELANVRGENAIDGLVPLNQTIHARGDVWAFKAEGDVQLTDEVSVETTGYLFRADAEAEWLLGSDGRRTGFVGRLGAKARAASASAKTVVDTDADGFLGYLAFSPGFAPLALGTRALGQLNPDIAAALETPVRIEVTKGVSGASAGLDGGAEAYYDNVTEEAVFGITGEVAAFVGAAFDLRIVVGGNDEEDAGGAGPNLIDAGADTVLVGD